VLHPKGFLAKMAHRKNGKESSMEAKNNRMEPIFTFAIISDTHINPEEGKSSSPWDCNRLSNARARYVIRDINGLDPDFVVHLGDLIHPIPALSSYGRAVDRFHELFQELKSELYIAPGNHDVGDKPLLWMPAEKANEEYIDLFKKHFGAHFYSFDFHSCHFVMINCQILNSKLESEDVQRTWLEKDLEGNRGKRIFLFTHYPPFITEPHETGHYDNIDEPARSWLLGLLEKYKIEALFAGHVHNFFYNRHANTDCYVLPSICFVRHDYSELFRIGPAKEDGRNDEGKFGYFLVKVFEDGHVTNIIRTYGQTLEREQTAPLSQSRLQTYHKKENVLAPIGVDMRYPWAEVTEIPYSGALDEFYRKNARNDYLLMALWEIGIRKLRVPTDDVLDSITRERMYALKEKGHEFTVFHYDIPQGPVREILANHHTLLRALELVIPWDQGRSSISAVMELKKDVPVPIYLSKLWSPADAEQDGSAFKHFINHGFGVNEGETIEALIKSGGASGVSDGFVFRLGRQSSPWMEIKTASQLAASLGTKAQVYVRLANDSPAVSENDEQANMNRVAETVAASLGFGDIDVFLDTFTDHDRGYFPRTGLFDRRYNPRRASYVFRHLHLALTPYERLSAGEAYEIPGGKLCLLQRPGAVFALVLPDKTVTVEDILWEGEALASAGRGELIDLVTGEITHFDWRRSQSEGQARIVLESGLTCSVPTLLALH
jgi:hypothetical protein